MRRLGDVDVVETLTAAEAAERSGYTGAWVVQLANLGVVEAVKVDRQWLLDGASLAAYVASRRAVPQSAGAGRRGPQRRPQGVSDSHRLLRLPAEPLVRLVDGRGGPGACGIQARSREERALLRARRLGSLTIDAADQLCVETLGLHPAEVWGDVYFYAG